MSVVAYICCVAVANLGLGFYWGIRHRENAAVVPQHFLLEAMDQSSNPLVSAVTGPSDMDRDGDDRQSELAVADSTGQEPNDSEPAEIGPSSSESEVETTRRAKLAWKESPKRLGEELERIERHLPLLRGCTDPRALQRVVDELTRVIRRELSVWNQAWEVLSQSSESPTSEQGLLEQAISQGESSLTNLNRLISGEDAAGSVAELEKELIKLRRIEAFPAGGAAARSASSRTSTP